MQQTLERRICFLRAINIGRANRVKMEAFRVFFGALGMVECVPYIQSGNFYLQGEAALMDERLLEEQMRAQLQIVTKVFLRSLPAYRDMMAACPYAERAAAHPKKLLVTFFGQPPRGDGIATLQEQMEGAALLRLSPAESELYTYMLPEQEQGNFSNNALERLVGMPATTRNWVTVRKMSEFGE